MSFLRNLGQRRKVRHGLLDADLFKVDLNDLVPGGGFDRHHLAAAEHLVLHDIAGLVVFGAGGDRFRGRCACKVYLLCSISLRCTVCFFRTVGRAVTRTISGASAAAAIAGAITASALTPICVGRAETTALTGVVFAVQIAAAAAGTVARTVTAAVSPGAAAPAAQTGTLFQHRAAGLLNVLRLDLAQKRLGSLRWVRP